VVSHHSTCHVCIRLSFPDNPSLYHMYVAVSLAGRFCTLPDSIPPAPGQTSSSVPLTFTLVVNPLMGHTSAAYSSQITPNLALSSRFDLNFYSYQSEWTIGGEWWLRKAAPSPLSPLSTSIPPLQDLDATTGAGIISPPPSGPEMLPSSSAAGETELGVLKMRASTAGDVSLLYTTRVSNMLVSGGVVSDLASSASLGGGKSPVKALGLEIQYFR
jgi:distribution and morphology protein 10